MSNIKYNGFINHHAEQHLDEKETEKPDKYIAKAKINKKSINLFAVQKWYDKLLGGNTFGRR